MKVRFVDTNTTAEVNDCYGSRLIEQGKAVFEKGKAIKNEPVKTEEPETAKAKGKNRKGE